jgi:hypothetical protein
MPGHSRSKNGVASLAYVPSIHVCECSSKQDVDGGDEPGHDEKSDSFSGRHASPEIAGRIFGEALRMRL